MLIKFRSEESADFVMLGGVAEQLLAMMGHGGSTKGSVSGEALASALGRLTTATAREQHNPVGGNHDDQEGADDRDEDEDGDEPEEVPVSASAAPLIAMLRRASDANGYVMWQPE